MKIVSMSPAPLGWYAYFEQVPPPDAPDTFVPATIERQIGFFGVTDEGLPLSYVKDAEMRFWVPAEIAREVPGKFLYIAEPDFEDDEDDDEEPEDDDSTPVAEDEAWKALKRRGRR